MFKRLFSTVPALIESQTAATSSHSLPKKQLSNSHPLVKKLFRPYLPADFESPGLDRNGKPIPPLVSQKEIKWLRRQAFLFGIDPDHTLKLPPLQKPNLDQNPIDGRLGMHLHQEMIKRSKKDFKKKEKLEKERMRLLQQRKITWEEIEQENERLKLELEEKEIKLPLRLRPLSEQQKYKEQRQKTIEENLKGMDEKIEQFKQKRRLERQKKKTEGKAF